MKQEMHIQFLYHIPIGPSALQEDCKIFNIFRLCTLKPLKSPNDLHFISDIFIKFSLTSIEDQSQFQENDNVKKSTKNIHVSFIRMRSQDS